MLTKVQIELMKSTSCKRKYIEKSIIYKFKIWKRIFKEQNEVSSSKLNYGAIIKK